ncbi:MAG: exopolysaccharide biosynthesis polyprenyl glycosylphosphotransferase, partial [Variibacter sp.]|nr:exopolysaccharide biosynthesis polyprenyl glycosylphosphotransferase [Variibacter sp.]
FLTALIFAGANVIRNEYTVQNYLSVRNHAETVVKLWALTFPFLLTVGFMTKTSESFSRGAVAVFFVVGVPIIIGARWLLVGAVNRGIARGLIAAQRLFIAGTRSAITDLLTEYQPLRNGIHVVGTMELAASDHPSPDAAEELRGAVAQAVERVRHLRPDAIVIAAPWWQLPGGTEPLRDFMNVPVDIYVTSQGLLDWASGSHISRLGPIPLFCIARHPFSQAEIIEKRIFDVVLGTAALVCCAPLMALAALLIRLDSRGPVLFLQRRYGFNQRAYRIIKFRTMTCLDDGDHVPQATVADVRITRVGRWLRRWNIDELPQLFNVLKGDMSLVGPRPHALQHNYEHESKIALYARRHNVKPGITGWAQVNGWRGETDREDKMRRRVEHDLYYIEHWSLWFDLYILFLTVFSRRSYANAR